MGVHPQARTTPPDPHLHPRPTKTAARTTLLPPPSLPVTPESEDVPLICFRIFVRSVIHFKTFGLAALSP